MGSELQKMNGQNKLALWAERVSACRSSDLSVRDWCKENDICEQTYYRWQRKLYGITNTGNMKYRKRAANTCYWVTASYRQYPSILMKL